MASPATGVPTAVVTNPRSVNIGGVPFGQPIADDDWNMILAAWGATPKREIAVDYDEGPPKKITKVTGA